MGKQQERVRKQRNIIHTLLFQVSAEFLEVHDLECLTYCSLVSMDANKHRMGNSSENLVKCLMFYMVINFKEI